MEKFSLLAFVWLIFFAIAAGAENGDEDNVIELDDVVVSATRTPASLDNISASSAIVPERQIRSSTATDLGRLLETTNILTISNYGPGGFSLASMRGSSSEQVLVLLDGERLNDSRSGGVDLNNIPIAYAKRIEVVRGGQSAMYGADAVGGIINIITKQPVGAKARAWSNLGAYGFQAWGLEASKRISPVSGLISFSQADAEADFPFEDKRGRELIRQNAESMTRSAFGKLKWAISDSAVLRLSGEHYYSDKGDPGPIGSYTPDAAKREKSNGLKANLEQSLTEAILYKLSVHKRDATLRYINPQQPYPVDDTHKTDALGAELQMHFLRDTSIPLIWGVSLRQDDVSSTAVGEQSRETYSAYAQQELSRSFHSNALRLSRIAIFPAIRWDHYSDFEAGVSPKLGFLASFGQRRIAAFKANTGRSYRAPTLNELYWPTDAFAFGNPDLTPERSSDADAGMYFHWMLDENKEHGASLPQLSEIKCGASLFWNSFRNRIQWTPGADGKWSPQNLSEAGSVGLELEMQTNASFLGLHDLFSLGARYTFLKARDMLERQLIYRPEHSLGYTLRMGTEKLWAQIQGIYQSRRYTTLQNTKWLDPFTKHDAQLGIERSLWRNLNIGIVLEVRNIFDKRYQLVADYPLPGREWSIKTSIGMEGE